MAVFEQNWNLLLFLLFLTVLSTVFWQVLCSQLSPTNLFN